MEEHPSQLDQISNWTAIVADTGDINSIAQFHPQDATTNPSLILKAAQNPDYHHLIQDAVKFGKEYMVSHRKELDQEYPQGFDEAEEMLNVIVDRLSVNFGKQISLLVPGYISTEVDARLSFDTNKTIKRARRIIGFYEKVGVGRDRILIKIASTYEGIQAAKVLEQEGIHCNLTLLFSIYQAILCAQNNVTLISPFVGRILDWHKKASGRLDYGPEDDPGVLSVRSIYKYYKRFGVNTIVMGASFRNKEEIIALAGCDRLTIAPKLLEELGECHDEVKRVLHPSGAIEGEEEKGEEEEEEEFPEAIELDEESFRWHMNEDAMATEKLSEGIRKFNEDLVSLRAILQEQI
jgi:transaldolase